MPSYRDNKVSSSALNLSYSTPVILEHDPDVSTTSAVTLHPPIDEALGGDDGESVRYLGSAMLSHVATGVGALQRPLGGLYFHAMIHCRGVQSMIPRCRLTVSSQGFSMSHQPPSSRDDLVSNEISSAAMKKRKARERTRTSSKQPEKTFIAAPTSSTDHYQSQIIYATDRDSNCDSNIIPTSHLAVSHQNIPSDQTLLSEDFTDDLGQKGTVHAISAVMFWESVQFLTLRGEDKKLRFAFKPLQKSTTDIGSQNGRNLFILLDTRFHWLANARHSPIFACVIRRPSGVKAIDVHAFLCDSEEQAIRLGAQLSVAHSKHSDSKQCCEGGGGGVFGYQPFTKDTVRSAGGQFYRRPPLRKMSAGPTSSSGLSVASRRQYGSTPALNMIFSVAPPLRSDHVNSVHQSSIDLSAGSSNDAKPAAPANKLVGSSLDSKIKASDYLKMGSHSGKKRVVQRPFRKSILAANFHHINCFQYLTKTRKINLLNRVGYPQVCQILSTTKLLIHHVI